MMDMPNGDGGRRFLPSFRNELSLGNLIAIGVMLTGGIGFLLRYESRMSILETTLALGIPALRSEFEEKTRNLDEKIGLARDVAGIRRGVDDLVDLHRNKPR